MKLLRELVEQVESIEEADKKTGEKKLYITGPFMEANIVNRNGRIYPPSVMKSAVNKYIDEEVSKGCAYGELNHPDGPKIDLDRACIVIHELDMQKNGQVIGKAAVSTQGKGLVLRGLMEAGARPGVSSRGLGSLKETDKGIMEVQDDFRLVTAADVVSNPSAPNAFVSSMMENVEWIFNEETGEWAEVQQKKLKTYSKQQIEDAKYQLFEGFLQELRKRK